MPKIGVQAMMLKDEFAASGLFPTLEKVAAIGYHAIEVSQIPMTPHSVTELDRARSDLGMEIASLSAGFTGPVGAPNDSLTRDFDKIVADCRRLDVSIVRIAMLPFAAMGNLETVLEFCDTSNELAQRLNDQGIGLSYHNHHIEFAKYDGQHLLDLIADRAPLVGLEVDVHWVARAGLDPVRVLEKFGDRVTMVHLKDYRIGRMPEDALAAAKTGDITGVAAAFESMVEFAEVGEGNLDFRSIIATCARIGPQYLLVEQDDCYGRAALECLRTSHANIVALGFGDLF
jgi:sugar phosphate isomerase/epimerase